MGERYNIHSQLEHLQSKYIGTGQSDTSKFEWLTNQHRDSNASYMGHYDLVIEYLSRLRSSLAVIHQALLLSHFYLLEEFFIVKGHLDKLCNLSHCKIEQVLSCSDSYTLERSLLAVDCTMKCKVIQLSP